MDVTALWIPATLIAAVLQVARNAMQRRLTETIGTLGATQVRFLYGFPFSLLFLGLVLAATGERLPEAGLDFAGFVLLGAASQVAATALMLAAMRQRSFPVVTALTKLEPVQIALFGAVVLGDHLSLSATVAIVVATAGIVVMTASRRVADEAVAGGARPILYGLAAAAGFALAAVGFRGAILALEPGSFLIRASTTLACGLFLQTALLGGWLLAFARPALLGSFREWRRSLAAGFVGAAASQFWFVGFALTAAVNVRTLALVEVLLAQALSRRLFDQSATRRELVGMAMIVGGVALLLTS